MKKIIPDNIISDFLNIKLIESTYIYINLWSFIHLFSGMILYRFVKNPIHVLGLLILYEIIEFIFWGIFFKAEIKADIIFDIIIGMAGFYIAKWFN